jgi:CubicO group peptidase (beta-lactamase class C family)
LLCHRSGLPRHDWIWMPGDLSRAQMLAAMRHIEPSRDIRTTFQYSNLGYNAASIVTERVSGLSWEDFTRTRITEPLKMQVTFTAEDLGILGRCRSSLFDVPRSTPANKALADPGNCRRCNQHLCCGNRQLDELSACRRRV